MKIFTLALICTLLSVLVFDSLAQSVSGIVKDSNGNMLSGVSVFEKGNHTNGTVTDADGKYKIEIEKGKTIVFSFIGLAEQEILVENQSKINAVMKNSRKNLDEVMVVAYGQQSKKSITGSVGSVSAEIVGNQVSSTPLLSLQGAVSGVNMITSSGQPGANPLIRIRGFASVDSSNSPLIILDGTPYNGNISSISNDQIETINVLKDASSASLYGSRAAAGVIIITTKGGGGLVNTSGNAKRITLSLSNRYGFSTTAVTPHELVKGKKYHELNWEAYRNGLMGTSNAPNLEASNQKATDELVKEYYGNYNNTSVEKPVGIDGTFDPNGNILWDTNWYNSLTRSQSVFSETTASFSGGTNKINYFVSANMLNQEGALVNSDFDRYTARVNLSAKLKDWVSFSTKTSFSQSNQNSPTQSGTSYTSALLWYYSVSPIFPVYKRDKDGVIELNKSNGEKIFDYGDGDAEQPNSLRSSLSPENGLGVLVNSKYSRLRTNIFTVNAFDFTLPLNFKFKTQIGYENYTYNLNDYDWSQGGSAENVGGRVQNRTDNTQSYTFTNTLSYHKTFEGSHNVSAKLLNEMYNYSFRRVNAQGTGFVDGVFELAGATKPESVDGYLNQERILSYMTKVDYNYKQRYFADLSFRMDGSSRFDSSVRFGNFYAVGANWIVSDEPFIKDISHITYLKLRASYGQVGNNRILDEDGNQVYFPYQQSFTTGWGNGDAIGVLYQDPVDKTLTWESSTTTNIGLDFGLFKSRLNIELEYYNKVSDGLLFEKPTPPSTGATGIIKNLGALSNSGIELNLSGEVFEIEGVRLLANFNVSTLTNEFTKLPQKEIIKGSKKYEVGKGLYDFYIREYADVNPSSGNMRWWKVNEDGTKIKTEVYEDATRTYQGSAIPDFYGGFGLTLTYKGFTLLSRFNYSWGGKIYDTSYALLMSSSNEIDPLSVDIENRWKNPGDITDVPRLTTERNSFSSQSTRYLFTNNYLRLKNITISYDFNQSLLQHIGLASARLGFSAENILTFQSHKGLEPEQAFNGLTDYRSPLLSTFVFSLNIGI